MQNRQGLQNTADQKWAYSLKACFRSDWSSFAVCLNTVLYLNFRLGPLFKERFISITVAEFSKVERRVKPSDSLHLSAAKCFSHIFILVMIIKLLLYIHTVQTLTYMQDWAKLKRNQGTFLGTTNANQK